jgi:zinc-ribbon domain
VDDTGDGRGALTATGLQCGSCGTELPSNSKFCNECGAPVTPGGVMLSQSTARLVDDAAALGEPELVQIKGADAPVTAYRLLGMAEQHRTVGRAESNLVGRRWELSAVEGLLERAIDGHGGGGGSAWYWQKPSGA